MPGRQTRLAVGSENGHDSDLPDPASPKTTGRDPMIQAVLLALLALALFPVVRRFVVRLIGRVAAVALGGLLIFMVVVALVQGGTI